MSTKTIKVMYGDQVHISDDSGSIRLSIEGERFTATHLTVEEARSLARVLNAFSEINER